MVLTNEMLALAGLILVALMGTIGYLFTSMRDLARELREHKDDATAHRTETEEKLWIRGEDDFRTEVRRRLERIEQKLDREP